MPRYLIFSDIDNTLLQSYIIKDGEIYHTEDYGEIKEIVQKLRKKNIPLVLCSSKTRVEQEKIRKYLEIEDPFIVENGGAIYIPENYFPIDLEELGLSINRINENLVIELGKSYNRIIETLQEIREIFHIEFIAVHDLSLQQLAQKVGITINDAKLMASREYSETVLEFNNINELDKLKKILNVRGLRILQGTRYNTISSLHDKGSAISILKKLYAIKFENEKIESIGIGDAVNDIPMFENVDKPFLVRNIQNGYTPMKINNIKLYTQKIEKMKEATIHIVPHMHYDAVWILNKEDYYFINIEYILKQAINLIKKFDYKFMLEQTFLLEKIEKDYPHIFADISDLIKDNKIEIAGGQYLLAENMVPNGEILIKEITEGKKFVKEKLNKDIIVSYGADEFGFNVQWPQILRNSGYKYLIFRRGI